MDIWQIPLLSLIFVTFAVLHIDAERDYKIEMSSYVCKSNPELVKYSNCSIDKSVKPPQGNIEVQLLHKIVTLKFNVSLSVENPKTKKKRALLNVKNINMCDVFRNKGTLIQLLAIYKSILMDFGDVPTDCPLEKDYVFSYKNIVVDAEKFPVFVPYVAFVIYLKVFTNEKFFCSLEAKGEVFAIHSNKINDKKLLG